LIGFGLCLFSFLLLSSPGVSPVFISGSAMPKTAFGLYVLVYLLACTQHALGPAWGAQAPPSTPMLYGFDDFFSYDNALSGTGDLFVRCFSTLLSLLVFAPKIFLQH